MERQTSYTKQSDTVEQVRAACVKTAEEAYERALSDGLCAQGAFEVAMDAMRSLDLSLLIAQNGSVVSPK